MKPDGAGFDDNGRALSSVTVLDASLPRLSPASMRQAADYVLTGAWGEKAAKEAKTLCAAKIAATQKDTAMVTIT